MVPGRAGRSEFEGRGGKMVAAAVTRLAFSRMGGLWGCVVP